MKATTYNGARTVNSDKQSTQSNKVKDFCFVSKYLHILNSRTKLVVYNENIEKFC